MSSIVKSAHMSPISILERLKKVELLTNKHGCKKSKVL